MVTTRGRHNAIPEELSASGSTRTLAQETPKGGGESTTSHDNFETVGSRLRRRRRTEPPVADNDIPTSKRVRRRKSTPTNAQKPLVHTSPRADLSPTLQGHRQDPIDPQLISTNSHKGVAAISGIPLQQSFEEFGSNGVVDSTGPRGQAMLTEAIPDLAAVISNIIHHGEAIDNHYAAHGLNELGIVDTESFLPLGASMHLKIQSLPILDNLAIQLLNTLAKSTFQEILAIATDPESENGQAYNTLKSLFDHTKKVYSIHEPFLMPYELGLSDPAHIEIIRKANLATFVSSVFGSQDVGFYHLNAFFLDTFVGDGNRLLKSQAQLFLDLKTQAFISAQSYGQRHREELLEDLFPTDLEERLLKRKDTPTAGGPQLAPSEADFLQRAHNRRRALLEEASSDQCMAFLTQKYVWEDFLRDVSAYVSRNFESLVGVPMHRNNVSGRVPKFYQATNHDGPSDEAAQQNLNGDREQIEAQAEPQAEVDGPNSASQDETATKATQVAQAEDTSLHGSGFRQGSSMSAQPAIVDEHLNGPSKSVPPEIKIDAAKNVPPQNYPPPNTQGHFGHQPPQPPPHVFYNQGHFALNHNGQSQFSQNPVNMNIQQQFYGDQPAIPFPTQSAPTQVLYERARQAATAKASPNNRRAGTPSQRRPWSTEEENTLMAGLDRVKGPHWSQILAMFGPGGTINEILKDRNQVQLKDKARNLKLFFLKSGIEVPYYLQCVTGELKTRAPAQAAKNEAKDRDKDQEERAHVEGVMTLAGVHEAAQATGDEQDADGDSTGENDLNLDPIQNKAEHFNSNQPVFPQTIASETNMLPTYDNEVTPAFQAMIDAAAAEAARVGAGGD